MLKAFAIKGVTLLSGLAATWALPDGWVALAIVAMVVATIGFIAWAILDPRNRFTAPVRLASDEPVVALTFDDGPDPVYTAKILDFLAAHHARATFFVVGERAARHPELVERMHHEGHTVGTHTQHHRLRFHFGSPTYVLREIEDAIAVVARILPSAPTRFRPPQGLRTPCFASGWRRTRGLTCVTRSVRGLDSRQTTAGAIVSRVAPRLVPGAIVALHDGTGFWGGTVRAPTLAALDCLLSECRTRGLRCVALGDAAAVRG